jgi:hypothetical protein
MYCLIKGFFSDWQERNTLQHGRPMPQHMECEGTGLSELTRDCILSKRKDGLPEQPSAAEPHVF